MADLVYITQFDLWTFCEGNKCYAHTQAELNATNCLINLYRYNNDEHKGAAPAILSWLQKNCFISFQNSWSFKPRKTVSLPQSPLCVEIYVLSQYLAVRGHTLTFNSRHFCRGLKPFAWKLIPMPSQLWEKWRQMSESKLTVTEETGFIISGKMCEGHFSMTSQKPF